MANLTRYRVYQGSDREIYEEPHELGDYVLASEAEAALVALREELADARNRHAATSECLAESLTTIRTQRAQLAASGVPPRCVDHPDAPYELHCMACLQLQPEEEPMASGVPREQEAVEFDPEEPACIRCGRSMYLRDGREWDEDARFNLCHDCAIEALKAAGVPREAPPQADVTAIGEIWKASDGRRLRVVSMEPHRIGVRNAESNRLSYIKVRYFQGSREGNWFIAREPSAALASSSVAVPEQSKTIKRLYDVKARVWQIANVVGGEMLSSIASDIDRSIAELESVAVPPAEQEKP